MPSQPAKPAKPAKKSAFHTLPTLVWALVAVIVILALAVGFLLANQVKDDSPSTPAASQSATQGDNGAPKRSVTTMTAQEIAELAESVEPGTTFDKPTGDPQTFGPGKPIEKPEDVMNVHRKQEKDPFAQGAVDAPVVISEYSDFECPFCTRHFNETEQQIYDKYVKTGLVRLEWNDLPVNGPMAQDAAKAGRAAAAQGKFAEFKKELYTAGKGVQGHPENDIEDFVEFAKRAGVKDLDKFRKDATGDTFTEVVENASTYATRLGVNGTPSFIIGDEFVGGAQPFEAFEQAIQRQLAKVANGETSTQA